MRAAGWLWTRMSTSGVRWNVNLNAIHLARPLYEVLATLLHELAHAWQYEKGSGAKPPHHNREAAGPRRSTTTAGRHGVPFAADPAAGDDAGDEPEPLLPEPPPKPKGSKLKKWICRCDDPVPVRVARADFDATCNRCGQPYRPA